MKNVQLNYLNQPLGTTLLLLCNSLKGSKPLTFQWFKDGQDLEKNPSFPDPNRYSLEKKATYSQLTINDIMIDDTGNYSCIVTNKYGFDSQWSLLEVKG